MTGKHNYRKMIEKLSEEHKLPAIPGLYVLHIFHDGWCNFLKGGECNCNPELCLQQMVQKDEDQK